MGDAGWDETVPTAGKPPRPTPLGSRYLLDYPVGQGSFGRVWRGRRTSDNTPVAIKVPRERYIGDPDVTARFLRERTMLQALSHPHLVTVFDLVVEGDMLAVVMEFVHGHDLRHIAKNTGLDTDDALTVLAQVAHALAYIHANGVLHRDIKPENILIARRQGQPWAQLTDFGLAWVADGRHLTGSSAVVGTPAYLAPELLTGRPYGPAVDVYALGVTAYELLSGQRPFDGENPLGMMRAHLEDQPERPARMAEDHWRVIRACLSKRPQERPTAAQLAAYLDELRISGGSIRLAINLGIATTTAVLRWPDGRIEPLLFDGTPLLPSAVYLEQDGDILTGRAALKAGGTEPERCDPYPRLRLAEGMVRLGAGTASATDLIIAILRRVARQARRVAGPGEVRVVVTHPPGWGSREFAQLDYAVRMAGLAAPRFVAEEVAAAAHLVAATDLPVGGYGLLYRVGAATSAVSVVRRTDDGGIELLASENLPDTGAIDVDAALLAHIGETGYAAAPEQWERLSNPESAADRRAAWLLWDDVREVKHRLGRDTSATVPLPLIDTNLILHQEQLEKLAFPVIERTLAAARRGLASAGVAPEQLSAIYLAGGSSRLPAIGSVLRESLGTEPALLATPELAEADGALHLTPVAAPPLPRGPDRPSGASSAQTVPPAPMRRPPAPPPRRPSSPVRRRGWHRLILISAAGMAVVVLATVVYLRIAAPRHSAAARCGYRIAYLGSTQPPGPAIEAAANLAIKHYDTTHAGCPVELVPFDTHIDENTSAKQADDIVADQRVIAVIGPLGDSEAFGALPGLDRAGVPVISPMLHDDRLATMGWHVFHRLVGTIDGDDAPAGVGYLQQQLKATKVFVVNGGDEETTATTQVVRGALGTTFAGSASITPTGTDYAAVLAQIAASGADGVYYAGYSDLMVPFLKQLRVAQPALTVLCGHRGYDEDALQAIGAPGNGIYATNPAMPPSAAGVGFTRGVGLAPDAIHDQDHIVEAYDAADIVLAGLGAGRTTRAGMLAYINAYDGTGLSGPIRFQPDGNRVPVTVWVAKAVDGAWMTIGPATATPGAR